MPGEPYHSVAVSSSNVVYSIFGLGGQVALFRNARQLVAFPTLSINGFDGAGPVLSPDEQTVYMVLAKVGLSRRTFMVPLLLPSLCCRP